MRCDVMWHGMAWCSGAREGMHFSQSKNAGLLNLIILVLCSESLEENFHFYATKKILLIINDCKFSVLFVPDGVNLMPLLI